ncbi:Tetrahydromethanopterin S-methyltransferase subunit A 1 [uncultured archaeon]|nr:Tetrahydromethanopterin S-methyltransferase subunit A 1 [uncultured archaeon]
MTKRAAISKRGYDDSWPPVRGDYVVGDPMCGVAVVTLASSLFVRGAAITGPCKTENLGVEKIIANVVSNCNIRFLIICGAESKGHLPGDTILALHQNGVDPQGRIVGSRGAIPFIQNLPFEAVRRFQEQVELVDCIGLEDKDAIEALIVKYQDLARPFPGMPFQAVRKASPRPVLPVGDGDLFLGSGVVADTMAWLALSED